VLIQNYEPQSFMNSQNEELVGRKMRTTPPSLEKKNLNLSQKWYCSTHLKLD